MSVDRQRAAALRVLTRVRRNDAWIHSVLDSDQGVARFATRERAFVNALVRGTVEHLGTLDALIDRWAAKPSGIEPQVRDALRIAAYEILYLSTPDRAAVNEGVELVRSVQPRAAGLANAILHRIAESAADQPFGDVGADLSAYALATGHPAWLSELMARDLGEESARSVMNANESPAPLYLAHNPFRGDLAALMTALEAPGCGPRPCDVPGSLVCDEAARTVASTSLREGRAIVCDLAAQAIVAATPLAPGTTVFESAAGRGTKTMLLQAAALRAGGPVRLVAADVHEFKTRLLTSRMAELGVTGVNATPIDSRDPAAAAEVLGGAPDLVFVDAPCSGLGTLRRHPEKRWSIRPEEIEDLAVLSGQLLTAALQLVRPEGFVVYSTCTLTHRENAAVVAEVLGANHPAYEIVSLRAGVAPSMARWVTDEGYFQSLPEPDGPDGHFAALIQRLH